MISIYHYLSGLLFFVLVGCNFSPTNNNGNVQIENIFYSHLQKVEKLRPDEPIEGRVLVSLFLMEQLTAIRSSANFGDISYYESKDSIRTDLIKWQYWFELNKGLLTADSISALEKRFKNEYPWIGD